MLASLCIYFINEKIFYKWKDLLSFKIPLNACLSLVCTIGSVFRLQPLLLQNCFFLCIFAYISCNEKLFFGFKICQLKFHVGNLRNSVLHTSLIWIVCGSFESRCTRHLCGIFAWFCCTRRGLLISSAHSRSICFCFR